MQTSLIRRGARSALVSALAATCLSAAACTAGTTSIGPLTLDVPEAWQITDREEKSIKLTDGTIADETSTRAGTATAVFDIYIDSSQTLEQFREVLRKERIRPSVQRLRIDGYEAVVLSYGASDFSPRNDVVFFPEWRVQIIYRAAFPDQNAAFERGRPAFRRALRSISFSGRPPPGGA